MSMIKVTDDLKFPQKYTESASNISRHRQLVYLVNISCAGALCVIFTILVSFSRDNALPFASKAKINIIWFSNGVPAEWEKTLILVFEVNVQPPKTHFLTFSSLTKIMKITHSECCSCGLPFHKKFKFGLWWNL